MSAIFDRLEFLYGEKDAADVEDRIQNMIDHCMGRAEKRGGGLLNENVLILITYGSQFSGRGCTPLKNLAAFSREYFKDIASCIHILPFYPYSSDDGFSVIDYKEVGEQFGTWEDISQIGRDFKLIFDLVCNHISSKSLWFQKYLDGDEEYEGYFIEADPEGDFSSVIRPRTHPLLTAFDTKKGRKYIWTTFSDDQIDLNFKNPNVLLGIIDVLLFYVEKGADVIRLDAVGFLWKKSGTCCMHLEETHKIVQLFRDVLKLVAPEVMIITETNVPHKDNISYFGDGHNEAMMVYQFPLPPLVLYSFIKEDADILTKWASTLKPVSDETTFFNFTASHDGIGINPVKNILSDDDMEMLIPVIKQRGGYVSYKNNPDGTQSPYEFNISYFDAINKPEDDADTKVKRFAASQAIALAMQGIPGLYIHSILGSQNYQEGVKRTGRYRSINREKFNMDAIENELSDAGSIRCKTYDAIKMNWEDP